MEPRIGRLCNGNFARRGPVNAVVIRLERVAIVKPTKYRMRILFSLVAAIPFALLQFVFLNDSYSWAVFLFGYMGIVIAAPLVFLGWCAYCFGEYWIRRSANVKQFPTFSMAGGILLLAFFLPSIVINPALSEIPFFCRVTQSVKWETSRQDPEWKSNESFILVLAGRGTVDNHDFRSGYMNWTGDEPAGFTSVDFNPVSFQERYYETNKTGSLEYLKTRMQNSAIPTEELDMIAEDVWGLLKRIDNGDDIHAEVGEIDNIYSHVDNEWDYFLGGWIWIAILILLFAGVGFVTINPQNKLPNAA